MALIAPFRGLRYNPAAIERMEDVVTPPYDIIDHKSQADLLAKNPYNMIQLDLSKSVTPEALTDERYLQARNLLDQWQDDSVLIRDQVPAIYLYNIEYTHPSGRRLTRKGLVCLVQLAEFSEGIVKPHEKTFKGVITDRVRLLDACRTQFSKVFSLYPDQEGAVMAAMEASCPEEPLCSALDQDGCRHTIWAVTDPAVLARVAELFAEKSVYIADGHHRYTTALQFREMMRKQGSFAEDSPANYIMMYLCPMEDPGLSVLPTHRLVRIADGVGSAALVKSLSVSFDLEEIAHGSREVLLAEVLGRMEEVGGDIPSFGLYHAGEDRCFLMTMKKGAMDDERFASIAPSLRALDVVVLSDLVIGSLLNLDHQKCEEDGLVEYFSDPDEALDAAVKEEADSHANPVIFLMNHTPVAQVKIVADEKLVMPHKSTYFYPKILTGLLLNKLVDGEKVG
ncbi:MAG: DUF1015 domain-containing protein [Proteobacteria bacterium]|nr:DUF1015 domain-containing protein [Pseudomonadota bacterium]MBU1716778.1 DUF1015 domain-containing protein [Pseudomonadota bacterium]